MTADQRQWIDDATYEQLLMHWRFSSVSDELLTGDVGAYLREAMAAKRELLDDRGEGVERGLNQERPILS